MRSPWLSHAPSGTAAKCLIVAEASAARFVAHDMLLASGAAVTSSVRRQDLSEYPNVLSLNALEFEETRTCITKDYGSV
jgi:hypothetical protein